jgi:hypothetical protein
VLIARGQVHQESDTAPTQEERGSLGGEPLEDPIAWPCGLTQLWTQRAVAESEAALSTWVAIHIDEVS